MKCYVRGIECYMWFLMVYVGGDGGYDEVVYGMLTW